MLLEFTCSNFKSIYKRIKLSMLASSDDSHEDELIQFDKYRINRMSAVYGPNGSGKTNVLESILFARDLVRYSMKNEPGDKIKISTHKLAKPNEPTEFTFQYVVNDIRYAYGFSVLDGKIEEEYLFYFPKGKQTKIFQRKKDLQIEAGDKFRKFSEPSREALKDNRLFLACAANYTSNVDIEHAFMFFKSNLRSFWPSSPSEVSVKPSIRYMAEHPELKDMYLKISDYLKTGIKNVEARSETKRYLAQDLPEDMPEEMKAYFVGKGITKAAATIEYDLFSTDLEKEESTGIKKLFAFLYPYIDTLKNGYVLICDEIETGLHESVVMGILKLFTKLYPDSQAQLIFTTHDTSLLDSEIFRRDQIWFTELDNIRSTDLYSLAEIKNVRKKENLKNGYVSGKYGAIPMLNPIVFKEMVEEINEISANSFNMSSEK